MDRLAPALIFIMCITACNGKINPGESSDISGITGKDTSQKRGDTRITEPSKIKASESVLSHVSRMDKDFAASWVERNFGRYFQKYNLSCEAAIIRLSCGLLGITDISEDDILGIIPRHPDNPNLGLVMEDITDTIYFKDGTVNWKNYGAHADVVFDTLKMIIERNAIDAFYALELKKIPDSKLIPLLEKEKNLLGAVIWVAAYIDGKKPARNEIGQVEGEHVQFVSPVPDSSGRMLVYDVWPWPGQPFHLVHPFNRDLFDNVVILIYKSGN